MGAKERLKKKFAKALNYREKSNRIVRISIETNSDGSGSGSANF